MQEQQTLAPTPVLEHPNLYAELKKRMRSHGLLDRQPRYYAYKITLTVALFALGLVFLFTVHNIWFQLVNAVFLAFVSTQLGFMGHDAGHRQIFRKTWKNDFIGIAQGNLLLGLSNAWWLNKHNQHHSHPNQIDMDPDINIPILSFTEDDAQNKRSFQRFVVKHQALFFFPILLLVGIDLQLNSIRFLMQRKEEVKYRTGEWTLLIAHHLLYIGILIYALGFWPALLFMLIHQTLFGLYLGSVFAPNHKGMPILEKESSLSFLSRQVLTARNVKASPFIDFWYGGLNYQIEHHLFPSMPRNKLREAQAIVRSFCQEHTIAYYETGMFQSYREILHHLRTVSATM